MSIQRQPAIVAAVIAAVFLAILGLWFAQSGTKSTGTLSFWPENPAPKPAVGSIPAPAAPQSRSETSVKNVSETQSSNPVFLACTAEKFSACSEMQTAVPPSTVTGSFLELSRTLLPLAKGNETIDNCIADGISACSNLAIQKKIAEEPSVDICDEYADPVAKQNCLNDVYPKVAIFKDDVTVCNRVSDEFGQKYCSDTYNGDKAVRSRDSSWCSRLSSADRQNECKGTFHVKVAVATDDIGFCAKSPDSAGALNCSRAFAMRKMDSSSIESCKKTYAYSSSIPDKGDLDRIHRDCLGRLTGEILSAMRANPDLVASGEGEYRQACGSLPETEKKVCLEQLATLSSEWAALPAGEPQVPATGSGTPPIWSGTPPVWIVAPPIWSGTTAWIGTTAWSGAAAGSAKLPGSGASLTFTGSVSPTIAK